MARRRRTASSFYCSALSPTDPNLLVFSFFVLCERFQIRRVCLPDKFLGDASLSSGSLLFSAVFQSSLRPLHHPPPFNLQSRLELRRSGGVSSSKTLGSPHRLAPPLSTSSISGNRLLRLVSVVVVSSFCSSRSMTEHFFTSKGHHCSPFLASVKAQDFRLRSTFMTDEPFTSINRRRRRLLSGLGQTSKTQSRWKSLCWAWSFFWTSGLYFGPLRRLGCKLYLLCSKDNMACPLLLQQILPKPSTFLGCLCHLRCHPLATSCLFSHRITGYFSGFLLPAPNTSSAGPVCIQAQITYVDSASAQIRQSLLTGYFSGILLPAIKADIGCFQPRTTFAGSFVVVTSQCMVTISLPVDDYVLNAFSLMGLLMLVCFDISPGALSSFFKLVSLCLFNVCSYVLFSKLAIRICPNKPIPFVSF
ncbi:unnamed protein product [Arabidopsis halleri]